MKSLQLLKVMLIDLSRKMKNFSFIIFTFLLLASCTNQGQINSSKSITPKKSDEKYISINDSTWGYEEFKNDTLRICVINHALENFEIEIELNKKIKKYNLNKLNIPFKTPELVWMNNEIVCFSTWWSGPFARYLCVPFSDLNKPIYIDKDIEETNSSTNNVLYVDTVIDEKEIHFAVENLVTRRKKKFEFLIHENSNYPYYDSLKLKKDEVIIWLGTKKIKFDISSINN